MEHDLKTERDSNAYVAYWKTRAGKTDLEVGVSCWLAHVHNALVVWLTPGPGGPPASVGQIVLNPHEDKLTQYGALQVSTQLTAFKVFVTSEDSASVRSPHGPPLFWADVRPR